MEEKILKIQNLNAYYGNFHAVKNVSVEIERNTITAILGNSGCGKTTFIRCLNRMHEVTGKACMKGDVFFDGKNISKISPVILRQKIGMVFQQPAPFPNMSIYDNVVAGYKFCGIKISKQKLDQIVEESLEKAALFDDVKDKLHKGGTKISGGEQQRLCIARALAMKPSILLLDEPTSAIDPAATSKIEEVLVKLSKEITMIIVTHNTSQAGRISKYSAFMHKGEIVEFDKTEKIFTAPKEKETEIFLKGIYS
jgi:phosphate transport system ATP-binding protein